MSAQIVVVMGVSGVGKSTVAAGISTHLGWEFAEGDAFHPQANVDKMHAGHPLNDDDRWPWLRVMRDWMADEIASGRSAVVTCSALKRRYRDLLREAGPQVRFLHLTASEELIAERLSHRERHFMPASLLHSQFEDLEQLDQDELDAGSVEVPVEKGVPQVITRSLAALGLSPRVGE
ncbi:gluconokinase [Calidifontibacter indicus]|uniref:gluconokinase n=1 Tax=Calidifontibacter indicus TaxID=419650 RepID=UPI003D70CA24